MAAAGPCALRITCPTDSEGRTLTGAADHLPPPTVRAVAGHHLAPPPQHGSRARDGGGHRGGGGPGRAGGSGGATLHGRGMGRVTAYARSACAGAGLRLLLPMVEAAGSVAVAG